MKNIVIYKLELLCVKFIPIIIGLFNLIDNILAYFDIYLDVIIYVAGTSVLTTIPMYISNLVYKFCKYHRMIIHYILVNKIISIVDNYTTLLGSDFNILLLNIIIAGIFIFLSIYYHWKYRDRNNGR